MPGKVFDWKSARCVQNLKKKRSWCGAADCILRRQVKKEGKRKWSEINKKKTVNNNHTRERGRGAQPEAKFTSYIKRRRPWRWCGRNRMIKFWKRSASWSASAATRSASTAARRGPPTSTWRSARSCAPPVPGYCEYWLFAFLNQHFDSRPPQNVSFCV